MDMIDIDRLCNNVADAVERVRTAFLSEIDISEMLDRYWCLQDQVYRLVESASDHREETFDILERKHSRLIQDIVDSLRSTEMHLKRSSAVSSASLAISRSLSTLDQLGQQSSVLAAGV